MQRTGNGPGILLLHGSGATTHSFVGLIEELAGSFEILAVDLPGHGFSSRIRGKSATMDNVSDALSQLLKEAEFNPALVVGHSAGAAIAVNMVTRKLIEPDGVVSINGAFYPFPGFARQLFPAMAKIMFLNPFVPKIFALSAGDSGKVRRLIASTGSKLSPTQIDYYQRAFRSSRHVEGTLAMMANWDLERMEGILKKLDIQLLQIIGAQDGTINPSLSLKTQELVSNSERLLIKRAGHLVHEEIPEAVAEHIVSFFDNVRSQLIKEPCVK